MMPRISLVTPTLNQGGTIRQTIESVLKQNYVDIEYWVFDAGSKDGTLEILREYDHDPRFHWVSEPDKGQSDAIGKGLARCTGDLFNWINSDDYLEPGALGKIAEAYRRNPGAHIISGQTAEFRGSPPQVFNRIKLELRSTPEESITVGVYCQPSTFWRTDIFRELGGADPALHCVMDWNLWVRYLALYGQDKVVLMDDLLAHFRHHENAKTTAISPRFYEEAATVFQNLLLTLNAPAPFLIPEAESDPKWQRKPFRLGASFDRNLYLGKYADRMVRVHRRKNPSLAKVWLKRALACKPWVTLWRTKMWFRLLIK
jgi:glycosyltransferase involved in cell wall biosynthesis